MSKKQQFNHTQATLTPTPPPPKTWTTPTYHLERYTIHRYAKTVDVQLHGLRGREKRTESISFPLVPTITDAEVVRAAVFCSPNKWTVPFGMNVKQFNGKFTAPLDGQVFMALIRAPQSAPPRAYQQTELPPYAAPTVVNAPVPQPHSQPPISQPEHFHQGLLPYQPVAGGSRGNLWQWYKGRSGRVKVGVRCGMVIALLLFFSCIGSVIGSSNFASTSPTPTQATEQAATLNNPAATDTPLPTLAPTEKPKPTPTPTPTGNLWYVSKNGSNADGKSWTTAWNDLNKIVWNSISPGDIIYIDGGTTACASNYDFVSTRPGVSCGMLYNSTLTVGKSGTAPLPITIKLATDAGHNGTAVFFGGRATPLPYCGRRTYSPTTVGTGLQAGIVIGNFQYVVLDGTKRSGFMIYGYDNPTQNAVNGTGIGVMFTNSSASNITVRNMEIFDNGVYFIMSSTTSLNGRYNSDSKGIQPLGSNLIFERLLIHDNGQDAFQTAGPLSNVTIQDSWLYERRSNPLYPGYGYNEAPHALGCTHVDGIQVYGGGIQSGLTFKNDIYGPLLGQGIYPSDIGTYFNNVTISNVLFMNDVINNINSDQQSTGGPQNWSVQNITTYQVPEGVERGWNTNLGIYSGTSNMSLMNSIVDNGNVQLPNFTGSGNINYNSDPVPGSSVTDPQFIGPMPTNNTPDYNTLVNMNFTPQCAICSGKGATFHTVQDLLNDIDMLNQ